MLSSKILQPRIAIRNSKIVPSFTKYPITFPNHPRNIDQRTIRTHEGINSRFIDNQIERLIRIRHLSYIHHIELHLNKSPRVSYRSHLINNYLRNVIVDYRMVAIFVEVLLDAAIATT